MLSKDLLDFQKRNRVVTKGPLSVVLQLTRAFAADTLPLDTQDYKTEREGQVKGLGGTNLSNILAEHGITRTLSREGGRTSRGSMGLMYAYADFINGLYERDGNVNFEAIEDWWVSRIHLFFANQPFRIARDSSLSLDSTIDDLNPKLAGVSRRTPTRPTPAPSSNSSLRQSSVSSCPISRLTVPMSQMALPGAAATSCWATLSFTAQQHPVSRSSRSVAPT